MWFSYAAALTWPLVLHLDTMLLGHDGVDVWNHAWGYWWVPHELAAGRLPWFASTLMAPDGGVLYFIDMLGALLATPLAWLVGPGITYNLVLLSRVALAGVSGQLLAEELSWSSGLGPGALHARRLGGLLAGLAYATSPYLLSELSNSISEVCSVHWVGLTVLAAVRAFRGGGTRRWLLLGLLQGLTTVSTFYYGLLTALMVGLLYVGQLIRGHRERKLPALLARGAAAAAVAVAVATPFALAFRASLEHPHALIERPAHLREKLLDHNAVDPLDFVMPGDFQSVRVAGEYFLHTAYLRWSIIALAVFAVVRRRDLRSWMGLAALSLVLALGDHLFTGGRFITTESGAPVQLPFGTLTVALPVLAITHPLRFSIFAQLVFSVLAGLGLAELVGRWPGARRRWAVAGIVGTVVWLEGALGSSATWPLPRADARIPEVYGTLAEGAVLDLPAEVGDSLATSRYLWFQTAHGHPIPYRVDIRIDRAADPQTFARFRTAEGGELPALLDPAAAAHIAGRYSAIVLHRDLERLTGKPSYYDTFMPWFGEPERWGDVWVWRLR